MFDEYSAIQVPLIQPRSFRLSRSGTSGRVALSPDDPIRASAGNSAIYQLYFAAVIQFNQKLEIVAAQADVSFLIGVLFVRKPDISIFMQHEKLACLIDGPSSKLTDTS